MHYIVDDKKNFFIQIDLLLIIDSVLLNLGPL